MYLNGFDFLSKPIAYRTLAGETRDAYMDYISKADLSKSMLFEMALRYISHIPRKQVSIKDFPQRGRAAFVGGGRRPPPLWRLAFEGYVGYRAMSRQKQMLLKDLLLKCRGHFKSRSFKSGSCAGLFSNGSATSLMG